MARGNGKEQPENKSREGKVEIVYPDLAEGEASLYANAVVINHSPWDFALYFSRVVMPLRPTIESGKLKIQAQQVATINVPVTLIRGLIRALQTNLDRYEQDYGKIEIPK